MSDSGPGYFGTAYGTAAVQSALDRLQLAGKGTRHTDVFREAAGLGRLMPTEVIRSERHDAVRDLLVSGALGLGLVRRDAERTVDRGLAGGFRQPWQPRQGPGHHNKSDVIEAVASWWDGVQASSFGWTGSALKVCGAFAVLACTAGKLRLSESVRQIAEAAGVSPSTVVKTRRFWGQSVRRVSKGDSFRGSASEWQLVMRAKSNIPVYPGGLPSGLFPNARMISSPSAWAWERNANAWRVYLILSEHEAATVRQIVEATGLHAATVRRKLKELEADNLACVFERQWRALPGPAELPTNFKTADRRKRHEADRLLWRTNRDSAFRTPKEASA